MTDQQAAVQQARTELLDLALAAFKESPNPVVEAYANKLADAFQDAVTLATHQALAEERDVAVRKEAENERLRADLERLKEQRKANLQRADETNTALMEEVKRYANGDEHPVLWTVYNQMHGRALNAEADLEQQKKLRAIAEGRHMTASERADAALAALAALAGVREYVETTDDDGIRTRENVRRLLETIKEA